MNIGLMYKEGRGVLQDYVEAHVWLNIAAVDASRNTKKDTELAQTWEAARRYRDELTNRMTPAQIAEAQRLAKERSLTTY